MVWQARKNGYDGTIVKNIIEGGFTGELRNVKDVPLSTDYIPISPNQIKSATENNGDFSAENDDIRYSIIGEKGALSLDLAAEEEPTPIGHGAFGDIYDQFKGKPQEAISFLMKKKGGEALGALHHKDIGEIDLVWGEEGTGKSDGYGLAKLSKYHPEVVDKLQDILDEMHIRSRSSNRINLESKKYQATVRLTWNEQRKTWLLTAFEKKNSVLGNTTDTDETLSGERNDTATPQNTVSDRKVTTNNPSDQIVPSQRYSIAGQPQLMPNETIGEYAARYNSWLEQERDKDIFDLYAKEYMRRKSRLTGKKRLSDRFEEFFYNAELTIENFCLYQDRPLVSAWQSKQVSFAHLPNTMVPKVHSRYGRCEQHRHNEIYLSDTWHGRNATKEGY